MNNQDCQKKIIKETEANNDDFWLGLWICTFALFVLTGTVLAVTQIYNWILIANDFSISNALNFSLKWLGKIVSFLGVCVAIGFLFYEKLLSITASPTPENRENKELLFLSILFFAIIKFIL